MMRVAKEYVLLIDGEPSRYYKDEQIKTYQSRKNAEKQARVEMRNDAERNRRRAKLNTEGSNIGKYPPLPPSKYATAKFSAIEIEEVTLDER
ncbi:MAG: hypothetical protein LC650_02765 [Actinobacteria bacterium]|nr:hypothetical protein [Actinomycetota bacterium]